MKGFPTLVAASLMAGCVLAGCRYVPPPSVTPGQSVPAAQSATRAQPAARVQAGTGTQGYEEGRQRRRRSRRGRPEAQSVVGQFDFYLLNLSWSPEYCATHGTSPECGHGLGFVVHGLWPQDDSGNYPEDCSNAPGPANPGVDTDIFPTASLVEHE